MNKPQDDLDASVADGVITREQADSIRARRGAPAMEAGQESFKLVSSFGDVFLCLGLVILFWSMRGFLALAGVDPLIVYGGFAALYWALAEFFTFRARRKFPAVVSSFFFAWSAYKAGALFFGDAGLMEIALGGGAIQTLAILTAALGAALIRFRLPILVLAVALSGVALVFTLTRVYWAEAPALWVLAGCGVALLMGGIWLDRQDPARTGPQHEWALWLFVVGSPLTAHPIFLNLIFDYLPHFAPGSVEQLENFTLPDVGGLVWTVAALALGFSLLGLLLDRRSLVASTLIYLSAVLTYAAAQSGVGFGLAAAIVPLTVGLLVVVLGVAWNPLRGALLKLVPVQGLFRPMDP